MENLHTNADPPMVIVDTDPGTDDAHALFMLLNADKRHLINLLGIICVNGNTNVDNCTRNALRILASIKRLDIPVYRGASEPIIVEPKPPETQSVQEVPYHGYDGFGDAVWDSEPDLQLLQREPGTMKLVQLAQKHKGKLNVVCLGPLTNIALAMKVDPEFASNIQHLYIMGGNFTGKGNITAAAEFNFHCDPEAAHIVLANAKCPITMAPLETCFQLGTSYEWRHDVLGKAKTPEVVLLNKIEQSLCDIASYSQWFPFDSVITAILIRPSMVKSVQKCHLTVELHGGRTRGQVVMDHKLEFEHNVHLVKDADLEVFKQLLLFAVNHPDCTLKL